MKDLKKRFSSFLTKILRHLPGGEIRRCPNISHYNTDCIHHLNHYGKCEDAWRLKWEKEAGL